MEIKSVTDGDTVTLRDGRVVRILGLDAPEPSTDEPLHEAATEALAKMVEVSKHAGTLRHRGKKLSDGRLLAYLILEEADREKFNCAEELVRRGLAYAYRPATEEESLDQVEDTLDRLRDAEKAAYDEAVKQADSPQEDRAPSVWDRQGEDSYYISKSGIVHQPNCEKIGVVSSASKKRYSVQNKFEAFHEKGKRRCQVCKPW